MEINNGKKRRSYYQAHSCADYLNWIFFEDTQYNEEVFEQILREAVARCPDKPAAVAKPAAMKITPRKKPSSPGGMGNIGTLKGRCASGRLPGDGRHDGAGCRRAGRTGAAGHPARPPVE